MERVRTRLRWPLVLWIALIGADRINLLGSHSAFVLTPFLALTPLVFLTELVRRRRGASPMTLGMGALAFLVLALVLLSLCVASVFVSRDFASAAPRVVQLVIMIASSFGVLLAARDRADLAETFADGARLGLWVFSAFNVLALLAWLKIVPAQFPVDQGLVRLGPDVYAGIVPRLSGMVMDSNRGGLIAVVFGFLIARGDADIGRRGRWLGVVVLLVLLTLSRSSILAGIACVTIALLSGERVSLPRGLVAGVAAASATFAGALLLAPRLRDFAAVGVQPILGRLTLVEGSSQDHMRLLQRAVATATESVPMTLHGLGYGSSHTVLQDFFPGDRYGNFHSIYLGLFAEAGIVALLVLVVLLGVPLARRSRYRALVAAIATFGVFYGALSEPVFWFALTLAWMTLGPSNSRENATVSATAAPRTRPSRS